MRTTTLSLFDQGLHPQCKESLRGLLSSKGCSQRMGAYGAASVEVEPFLDFFFGVACALLHHIPSLLVLDSTLDRRGGSVFAEVGPLVCLL